MFLSGVNNIWLGTKDSYQNVSRMSDAVSAGRVHELIAKEPNIGKLMGYADSDDDRIGAALLHTQGSVGIVTVSGSLVANYAWYNSWFGVVSYEEIKDAMSIAAEDDNIKKILLRVESGGGDVMGLDDMGEYIRHIDENVKPVEGYTSSYAYSAGYWLLSSTRSISSARMASTGSIGVIMTLVTATEALKKQGVEYHYIRSGEFKALGQIGEELSPEAKADFQAKVMNMHKFFMNQVFRGRPALAAQNKDKWESGKTFMAAEAKSIGLVDNIISFDQYVAKLHQTGNNSVTMSSNSTSNSLSKEAIMFLKSLTAEQREKLAAGVPLEALGLSAEDLATAQAELAAQNEEGADADAEDVDTTEEAAAEEEADAEEESEEEAADDEESPKAADEQLLQMNANLNKELGKLEIKLEAKDEELAAKQAELDANASTIESLLPIAAEAIGKMQAVLKMNSADLSKADAKSLVDLYAQTKEKFESTFQVGAKSTSNVGARDDQASLQQPNNPINKVK